MLPLGRQGGKRDEAEVPGPARPVDQTQGHQVEPLGGSSLMGADRTVRGVVDDGVPELHVEGLIRLADPYRLDLGRERLAGHDRFEVEPPVPVVVRHLDGRPAGPLDQLFVLPLVGDPLQVRQGVRLLGEAEHIYQLVEGGHPAQSQKVVEVHGA